MRDHSLIFALAYCAFRNRSLISVTRSVVSKANLFFFQGRLYLWWLDPVYKLANSFVKHTHLSHELAEEIIHQGARVR